MAAAAPALTALFTEAAGTAAAGAASDRLTNALTSALPTGGGGGGDTYGLGGKIPGGFTKALKLATPRLAAFAKGLEPIEKSVKALEDWGDSLLNSRRHLMAFNGTIAGTVLEAERRTMVRNIKSGAGTGLTTQWLSQELNDFKDEIQPFKDAMTNGFNVLAAAVIMGANTSIQLFEQTPFVGTMMDFARRFANFGGTQVDTDFVRFIEGVRRGVLDNDREADRNLMEAGGAGPRARIEPER